MKKSKLLQSSKEMLSRSFNPTKCKTSLRLAASRLKLMKNKKEVQVKQMKKEIAQLLESGQEQNARMRVEHVIREEKMMAAYDLLEIYCELIIARLPVIESQKNCPIDLKEAITSVIFASLRCGDLPELLDIRKQLTAKYGKDFATAAIELRPQCGVGRLLVEKLSAAAPDVQMKTKVLSAIAEEHNVKWDHESLEEKDSRPSSDLPGEASYYGNESKPQAEQTHFEAAVSQARPNSNSVHSAQPNVFQHDQRFPVEVQKVNSSQPSVATTKYNPESRPQGDYRAQLFHGNSSSSSPGEQRWNMEFKDATAAAQAAAESAEQASLAAKAAAELSMRNKIIGQDSTEFHRPDAYISKAEGLDTHSNPKVSQEQFPEGTLKKSSPGSHNEKIDRIIPDDHKTATRFKEDNHGGSDEYNQPAPLLSKSSSTDGPSNNGSRVETVTKEQSFKNLEEPANDWAEKTENHEEKKMKKQNSANSSRSHSSISDDVNIFANSEDLKYEEDAGENPFVDNAEGIINAGEASHQSHEDASVFYDKFDSDTDDHGFDLGPRYDIGYSDFNIPSVSLKSPDDLPVTTDSWIPKIEAAETVDSTSIFFTGERSANDFSESITSREDAEVNNFAHVTYDDYDGPSSDNENLNTEHHEAEDSVRNPGKVSEREQSSTLRFEDVGRHSDGSPSEQLRVDRKQLSISSDDELDHSRTRVEMFHDKNSAEQQVSSPKESREISGFGDESSSDGEERLLNLPKLVGGLRNKGRNSLPFSKNVPSSVDKETEKTGDASRTSNTTHFPGPKRNTVLHWKKNILDSHCESDSNSSEDEEFLQRQSGRKQGTKKEIKTKHSYVGSNSSDSDEDQPKVSLSRKSNLQSGMSRRTRTPTSSGKSSSSKIHLRSEANENDTGNDRKPISSHGSETWDKNETQRRNSGEQENHEQNISAKVASKPAKSSFWGPPEQPEPVKTTSIPMKESETRHRSEVNDSLSSMGGKSSKFQSSNRTTNQMDIADQPTSPKMASKPTSSILGRNPEKPSSAEPSSASMLKSKITQKSSTVEKPSKPTQKAEASISSEVPKSETANKASSDKPDTPKRASHVHPKLPDYDDLLQSLRMKRS
ncbi:uncharacterized protein LOC127251356 isoform X2 [Andrographis paniculata]|uniref:uncharacterized protein LOC127251356 isoform X2 n=1 Tax=Andrographis paniculata TaxID=175694 RepID=UPI0021E87FD0|nr:uncharacterized protein LOC127251356 isoform X2 [Andrographis paniculata]